MRSVAVWIASMNFLKQCYQIRNANRFSLYLRPVLPWVSQASQQHDRKWFIYRSTFQYNKLLVYTKILSKLSKISTVTVICLYSHRTLPKRGNMNKNLEKNSNVFILFRINYWDSKIRIIFSLFLTFKSIQQERTVL